MRVLVACEYSGRVRQAFRGMGHDAWSVDLIPSEDGSRYHIQGDVLDILKGIEVDTYRGTEYCDLSSYEKELVNQDILQKDIEEWDLMIAHPPCTRLANSGVRWLHERNLWDEFEQAVEFYLALRNAPIPMKCLENPVMHKYATERLGNISRQIVQPWWFGEKTFKTTGYELHGLPALVPTDMLTPPNVGTEEHKAWSWVHRCPPGPDRWKIRSRTPQGIANAMAAQWGVL